jgi:hypothetical protein
MQTRAHYFYWTVIAVLCGLLAWSAAQRWQQFAAADVVVGGAVSQRQPSVAPPMEITMPGAAMTKTAPHAKAAEATAVEPAPASLSAQWTEQTVDTAWAPRAEQDIHAAAAAAGSVDTEVLAAACRASICRAELLHKDEQAQQVFMHSFPAAIQWKNHGQMEILERSETGIKTVVFVASDE